MTSAHGCPSCGAALTGSGSCPACGLPLHGPVAARLWTVDQQLAALREERQSLLARLRSGDLGTAAAPSAAPSATSPRADALPGTPPASSQRHHETSPERVQNTLLTLGAVLLALAGVVFAAVTYQRLGVAGRAAVLLTLTATAGWAPVALRARRLTASAEAVGGVALALAVLDAVSLRRAGVGDGLDGTTYALVASAALTGLTAAYARAVPLHVARVATVVLAQLPLPLLLARLDADRWAVALLLSSQAALDLLVAARAVLARTARATALVASVLLTLAALGTSMAALGQDERSGSLGVAAVAAVLALASWLATDRVLQAVAALAVVPLLGGAALAAVRPEISEGQRPLVLVAVTLLALQVAALLPQARRVGPALSALLLAAGTLLVEAEAVLAAVGGPFLWLLDPWSRTGGDARSSLAPDLVWTGTVVTLVVLAGTAVAVLVAGALLERVAPALPVAGVLVVLAAGALPLGLATSYRDAMALLLAVAVVFGAAGFVVPRLAGAALLGSASATALLACAWSLADQDATLVVLPLAAALVAALSIREPGVLTGTALLLGGAEVAALGVAEGLAEEQVGAWLLAAAAVPVALTFLLRGRHRSGAEASAAVLGTAALVLATGDSGWLSWILAGAGLLALAVAVQPDRRAVGVLGALLLSASSWVRLMEADVVSPEPYVAPIAAIALGLGHLRRRAHPTLDTLTAYGPGLTFALVPSLLRSFADDSPTRGVLLLFVCVALVLVGARTRTRAGLVVGTAVALADALNLVGPYAAGLPRWLPLALLGLLLVVLGATYEQRLRDLKRLRDRYDQLA